MNADNDQIAVEIDDEIRLDEALITAILRFCTEAGLTKREVHDYLLASAVVICDADEYSVGRFCHLINETNKQLKTLIN